MSCGRNRTTNSCACAISLSRRVELQFKRERATTMKVLAAFAAVLMLVAYSEASVCKWGPSYWCQSRTTAQQCGQEKYCQDNVWKVLKAPLKAKLSSSPMDTCSTCKLVAQLLKGFIDNNKTETEAEDEVKKLCNLLPAISSECNSLVDDFFNTIWQYLMNEMSPDDICDTLGLCNSTKVSIQSAGKANSLLCEVCDIVVYLVHNFAFTNKTEDEAKELVEEVCNFLGDLKSDCTSIIDSYWDTIWRLIAQEVEPGTICPLLVQGCSGKATKTLIKQGRPENELCSLCEEALDFLKTYVDKKGTEAEVESLLETACNDVGPMKSECLSLVKQYFPMVWMLIDSYVENPNQTCTLLKLCGSSSLGSTVNKLAFSSQQLVGMPKGSLCSLCEMVVSLLKPIVDSNSTEAEVQEIMDKFCGILPSNYSTKCHSVVTQYFPLIWELLETYVNNPDQLCQEFNFCNSTGTHIKARPSLAYKGMPKQMPKQDLCSLCKLVVNFLQPYVDNNSTEQEVENALEGLCNLLPSSISSTCDSFVKSYFSVIWQLLQSEFNNDEICIQLGLCNSTKVVSLAAKPQLPKMPKQDLCSICKLVVSFLEPYVDNNSTEQEVENALEGLCNLLPSSISNTCDSFVKSYFPLIWQLVQSEFNNDEICIQLGLCNSTKVVSLAAKPQLPKMPKQDLCSICKLVVSFLEPYVDNNSTEQEVENALEGLCKLLPSSISTTNNDEICIQLGLCNSTKVVSLAAKPQLPKMPKQYLCSICKLVVNFLEPFVDSNSTEQEVEDALEGLCNLLPSSISSTCDSLVQQYFPLIWAFVQSEFNNDEICIQLGLCGSTKVETAKPQAPKAGILCVVCEFVMKKLESLLINNATEAEIEVALDKVCSFLPHSISSDCDSFVKQYTPEIVKLLLDEVGPNAVCAALRLCTASMTTLRSGVTNVKGSTTCTVCTDVLSFVKTIVGAKATQAEVEHVLSYVCGLMPSEIRNECKDLVNSFGPDIIQLIDDEIDPSVICKKLGLCSSALMHPWTKLLRTTN